MGKYKNILELSSKEAKDFFLQSKNYCTLNLPKYFQFQPLLNELDTFLKNKTRGDYTFNSLIINDIEQINSVIYDSKNGQYQWRPLQIIHPVLYLELLNIICEDKNWKNIKKCFALFQENKQICCTSIPIKRKTNKTNTASIILNWWQQMEQTIIAESLNFSYIFTTDITDFYPSIYTHTISWALHGKDISKKNKKNDNLLGNKIDNIIQNMQNGQTNGIPQGSVIMDFIAEIILGYADLLLSEKIKNLKIFDYKIFRYRDDYKILVNNPKDGEIILKNLTEILLSLNLKLNTLKTKKNEDIITTTIKDDKISWITNSNFMELLNPSYKSKIECKEWKFLNQQNTLLGIYQFSKQYPNSGTVCKLLTIYCQKLNLTKNDNIQVLISILTSIMSNSPKTFPIASALLSQFLMKTPKGQKIKLLRDIQHKLYEKPHTDLLDIWLQRISWNIDPNLQYEPKICKMLINPKEEIWDMSWLNRKIQNIFHKFPILDKTILNTMPSYIEDKEVDPFSEYLY